MRLIFEVVRDCLFVVAGAFFCGTLMFWLLKVVLIISQIGTLGAYK